MAGIAGNIGTAVVELGANAVNGAIGATIIGLGGWTLIESACKFENPWNVIFENLGELAGLGVKKSLEGAVKSLTPEHRALAVGDLATPANVMLVAGAAGLGAVAGYIKSHPEALSDLSGYAGRFSELASSTLRSLRHPL
ncbi:MAG: hypothetical protein KDK78_09800 [Chlamydiia bacterium]|nr:hypothetical protein [Chlamydiia bacterium]